jgi:hypothetical protein
MATAYLDSNSPMIDTLQIVSVQSLWTQQWHEFYRATSTELPFVAIEDNHHRNFELWHEEDIARRNDLPLERIVEAKRNIDRYNQLRNNSMEKIDDWLLSQIASIRVESNRNVLHSETPGMMIDRLSIMALKRYHMYEEATRQNASEEHRQKCASRVVILDEQIADLSHSLAWLLAALASGERRFKVYRQFKMYNDPTLNPQLYSDTGVSKST